MSASGIRSGEGMQFQLVTVGPNQLDLTGPYRAAWETTDSRSRS